MTRSGRPEPSTGGSIPPHDVRPPFFSTVPRRGKPCCLVPAGRCHRTVRPDKGVRRGGSSGVAHGRPYLCVRRRAGGGNGSAPSRSAISVGLPSRGWVFPSLPPFGRTRSYPGVEARPPVSTGEATSGAVGTAPSPTIGSSPQPGGALSTRWARGDDPWLSCPGGLVGSAEGPAPGVSRRRAGEPHVPGHPGRYTT